MTEISFHDTIEGVERQREKGTRMKTIKRLIKVFKGESQGLNLPDWVYYLLPSYEGDGFFKWGFWRIKPKNALPGDTLFMALKRK